MPGYRRVGLRPSAASGCDIAWVAARRRLSLSISRQNCRRSTATFSSSDQEPMVNPCHLRRGSRCNSLLRLDRGKYEHRAQPCLPSTLRVREGFPFHSPAAVRTMERPCQQGQKCSDMECPWVLGQRNHPCRQFDRFVRECPQKRRVLRPVRPPVLSDDRWRLQESSLLPQNRRRISRKCPPRGRPRVAEKRRCSRLARRVPDSMNRERQ